MNHSHTNVDLILRYLDDNLSNAEYREFEDRFRNDSALGVLLASLTFQSTMIRKSLSRGTSVNRAQMILQSVNVHPGPKPRPRWSVGVFTGRALAALLVLAVTTWFVFPSGRQIRHPEPSASVVCVATLTNLENAAFSGEPIRLGSALPPGSLQLQSGKMQIMFTSDAVVDLTGPCNFEMTGPNRGKLVSGVLNAYVPERAHGFTVDLPDGSRIVDLGTRFTVRLDHGSIGVHVLEGRVAFDSPKMSVATLTLKADQAVYVDPQGRVALSATHTTSFASADAVLGDGREPGFMSPAGVTDSHHADTVNGWTWYTVTSKANASLTVPFGRGTAALGEQIIRSDANGPELRPHDFYFGYNARDQAVALRGETFTDVAAGSANVNWAASNGGLRVYYSQDRGVTWNALARGVNFKVEAGSLEIIFVANDGVDSNTALRSVSINYPVRIDHNPNTTIEHQRGRPVPAPSVEPSP